MRTYIDTKFLNHFKVVLRENNSLPIIRLKDFLVKNNSNKVVLAEKNRELQENEIASMLLREGGISEKLLNKTLNEYSVKNKDDFIKDNVLSLVGLLGLTDEEKDKISQETGFFFANLNDYSARWNSLSINGEFNIPYHISSIANTNAQQDYSFLDKHSIPCNAVLICDRYMRGWSLDALHQNLTSMILSLASESFLCKKFYVTIIVGASGKHNNTLSNNDFYNELKNMLCEYFSDLSLSIIQVNEGLITPGTKKTHIQNILHDRRILTNYFQITSGHGFDIIGNPERITTIRLGSILYERELNEYNDRRKSYKHLVNAISEFTNGEIETFGILDNPIIVF